MSCEPLRSITEATVIARQAQRDGQIIPISPCIQQGTDGKPIKCPYVDPKLARFCTEPDGILAGSNGILECPKQKGRLAINGNGKHADKVTTQKPTIEALEPIAPEALSKRERLARRPYFSR